MKMKRIPRVDEDLSAVGFGCWGISGSDVWNNTTDADSMAAIHRALDRGINFFDVAPVYGLGHAETILGHALKGHRHEVLIASKCGLPWDDQKNVRLDLSAGNLYREIDDSLRRLSTDYVDIYQMHWPDPKTPIEESMEALLRIKESGKIRHIGVSNFSADLTREALALGEIATYQGLYNLLERNPTSYHAINLDYRMEKEIVPLCREHGIGLLPYSPLFQGLLTDAFKAEDNFDENDVRSENPKLNGEAFPVYFEMSERLRAFARRIGRPLSQVAINWLIRQDVVASVISGGQIPDHVEENAGSASWTLTDEMVDEIEALLAPYKDAGLV